MFERRAWVLVGAVALTVGLAACVRAIPGSGRPASQTRPVSGLRAVTASGGAHADLSGIDAPALRVEVSGGGRVTAAGTAAEQEVSASGGATYDGRQLSGRSVRVSASGGAHSVVNASDELDAHASGGARVEYLGSPRLQRETSGGGAISAY